jgi:hypothetical protein
MMVIIILNEGTLLQLWLLIPFSLILLVVPIFLCWIVTSGFIDITLSGLVWLEGGRILSRQG